MKRDLISKQKVSENPALTALKAARSVLLLQGPVGPFFDRLAQWLIGREQQVNRIVFSGGDLHDCQILQAIKFSDGLDEWAQFFSAQCIQLNVDVVVLFGQSRIYHQTAIAVANRLGIEVVVLEEGYFRPGFVTMELGGVNGNSTTLDRFNLSDQALTVVGTTDQHPFLASTYFAAKHYAHMFLVHLRFASYVHHRPRSVLYYQAYWFYSWLRKFSAQRRNLKQQAQLLREKAYYYFIPLQFEGDAQLKSFSNFSSIQEFLSKSICSFSRFAPKESYLVLKEHPHGRGTGGYQKFVKSCAKSFGVQDRVIYLVEGDTPVLVQHAAGVITINSTVGIRALKTHVPLIAVGSAIYKRSGLVFDGQLNDFWCHANPADPELANAFIHSLKHLTQVAACAYATRDVPIDWA